MLAAPDSPSAFRTHPPVTRPRPLGIRHHLLLARTLARMLARSHMLVRARVCMCGGAGEAVVDMEKLQNGHSETRKEGNGCV